MVPVATCTGYRQKSGLNSCQNPRGTVMGFEMESDQRMGALPRAEQVKRSFRPLPVCLRTPRKIPVTARIGIAFSGRI